MLVVALAEDEMRTVRRHARLAAIGGRSQIHDPTTRRRQLREDQLVGMAAQAAVYKWAHGTIAGFDAARQRQNQTPYHGDGGQDFDGYALDIKASLWRSTRPLLDHRLAVRPKERHDGWTYILAMVSERPVRVHLLGWCRTPELPATPEVEGVFAGAYTVPAKALHDMEMFRWSDVEVVGPMV